MCTKRSVVLAVIVDFRERIILPVGYVEALRGGQCSRFRTRKPIENVAGEQPSWPKDGRIEFVDLRVDGADEMHLEKGAQESVGDVQQVRKRLLIVCRPLHEQRLR